MMREGKGRGRWGRARERSGCGCGASWLEKVSGRAEERKGETYNSREYTERM
jgi:hypothetical protein